MLDVTRPLAANLRRLRAAQGLTTIELARRSGVGRATLTQLESGGGNPTLETLYALANVLAVPLAALIADPEPEPTPRVLRRGEGEHAAGAAVDAWLLHRQHVDGASVEIYALVLRAGAVQRSEPHPPGTREHVHLTAGRARFGPSHDPVDLAEGDYADYPADTVHQYQALGDGPATATLIIIGPPAPGPRSPGIGGR